MRRFRAKAWQSVLVLAMLAPVFLDGCVSIGVSRSKTPASEAATGSLDVTVVESPATPDPPLPGSSPNWFGWRAASNNLFSSRPTRPG